ncbi:chromate efflux transporter [Paraburkholderia sp. CNPSo 3157]|uniref:Chromate efflux transporter n=1 Tax=Paraburkholderia franconis TaxID=2654983 RepID=A0A7X1TI38_9BURK|nr:chromate efflux transporter [Paraburkholderia franconis]MPW20262.1 chromate efflux transporter [Paraburkholderia franconis]
MESESTSRQQTRAGNAFEVLWVFLQMGCTCFGGPIAHLGYFRREFVERRRWLDDTTYTDLIALCQFLPGPASSQVGFSIGLLRAGWWGGLAAWLGFTLPSAVLLTGYASLARLLDNTLGKGLVHGLKLVAVAVVAQAIWDMARRLCPDRARAAIALAALALLSVLDTVYAQLIVIGGGALLGTVVSRMSPASSSSAAPVASNASADARAFALPRAASGIALVLFCVLLAGLPALEALLPATWTIRVFDVFYRSGALVFGGGHVVLPLLQQATVASGWISANDFLAGYGAAQAVPGPLFTFASYLGWMMSPSSAHWLGALCATVGIFLPGLLLVIAVLPHWQALRTRPSVAALLAGANAAVVGLLASAFYAPVWTSAVLSATDFAVAVVSLLLLTRWNVRPLFVVLLCAGAGIVETFVR